jgi:lipid-A-disaccharide synthase
VRLLISAGEASGEAYGASLITALRKLLAPAQNSLDFFGLGGRQMEQAGCELVVHAGDVAVVGLAEVLEHLPRIYRLFHQLVREAERRRPDAAVIIDFPDFNFRLARELHKRNIPVIYYVSPQLWAWRQTRVQLVRKYVSKMLVIFPFEVEFYRRHGIDAEFVGHPLANMPRPATDREEFASRSGLDPQKPWIALLPGSRRGEVSRIFPKLLEAAKLLGPEYVYITPVASTLDPEWMKSFLEKHNGLPVKLTNDARATMAHCRAAAVASGTSTIEAALLETPFAMVYQVAPLTWRFGRRLVKLDRFAMPNLIAGRDLVPELVQDGFTPEHLCAALRAILPDGPARTAMIAGLGNVRRALQSPDQRVSASERAARAVLQVVGQQHVE